MFWESHTALYACSMLSTSSFLINSEKSTSPLPSLSQSSYKVWISSDNNPGVDSPVSPSISTATSNSSRVTPRSSLKSKNLNASSLEIKPFSSILHWIMA